MFLPADSDSASPSAGPDSSVGPDVDTDPEELGLSSEPEIGLSSDEEVRVRQRLLI